uniref:Uncharacterized protein n=1 Tax=Chaetoceros debilis TaxID=122233 RepID=A0A7S3QI76_9STRA
MSNTQHLSFIFRFYYNTRYQSTMPPSVDSFVTNIQQYGEKVPKKLNTKIEEIARKAVEEMSKEAGNFFHEELNDDIHTEEQVKAIIELFPESLSQRKKNNFLPIQSATMSGCRSGARSSVSFVPLMASEGYRLGVGGEGNRGGLLSVMAFSENGHNTIKYLAGSYFDGEKGPGSEEYDRKRVRVLEKLRGMNLLKKVDIEEYALVNISLGPECQHRFEFFTSWDPDALGARDSQWRVPIHDVFKYNSGKENFEMALQAGMAYFPERFGFLFHKVGGTTACKKSFDEIEVDTAMNIIRRCIPPSDNHLILHHALEFAPNLVDDIGQYYPDAAFLRDTSGHTLTQFKFYINLRRGRRKFKKNSSFFIKATDNQVNSIHPETGLCPFMLAAVGNKSDITAVYYLLSRNPKLVGAGGNKDSDGVGSSRKRQREDID